MWVELYQLESSLLITNPCLTHYQSLSYMVSAAFSCNSSLHSTPLSANGYKYMYKISKVIFIPFSLGNYGPRFPPYYIFMKSYWFQSKSSKYNSKADDTDLFFGNDVEHVTQETREKQGIRYVWGVMESEK